MRQYRGKTKDGKWVEGWYFSTGVGAYIIKNFHGCIPFHQHKPTNTLCITEKEFVEVLPETVGQDTGLKDKNGVEIYKGDLLRVQSQYETDEPIDSAPNKVYWDDGGFRCEFHYMLLGEKVCTGSEGNWNCEVVGNIHEGDIE